VSGRRGCQWCGVPELRSSSGDSRAAARTGSGVLRRTRTPPPNKIASGSAADAAWRAPTAAVAGDLVGQTLSAGVFKSVGLLAVSGTPTLDGQGDPNSVRIFQIASALITASVNDISMIKRCPGVPCLWQVGGSAMGTTSHFVGTITWTSITVTTDTVVVGRALAVNGPPRGDVVRLTGHSPGRVGCSPATAAGGPFRRSSPLAPVSASPTAMASPVSYSNER
jgi:hypothetical protein